jgi:hypothetical protein
VFHTLSSRAWRPIFHPLCGFRFLRAQFRMVVALSAVLLKFVAWTEFDVYVALGAV